MSLDALALRVLLPSFAGTTLPADWARLLEEGLGGVCLFGSNLTGDLAAARELTDAVRRARADALVATDEEGGDVSRLHARAGSPVLGAAQLGAVDSVELTAAVGRAVAADLVAAGIDLDLGPVADVNSNPDNPVIGTRSFGADPALVGRHVAAWVGGLQEGGVAACVKHFPGHGSTAEDSHLALPVLDAPGEVVRERDVAPFAAAVAAGAASVMTSHIVVPAVDPDLPATFSRPVLALLRDELAFEGAIVSDALDMAGASRGRGIPEAAVLALVAGVDLLCIGPDKDAALVREVQAAIVDAVRSGRLAEERLAEAAGRVDAVRGFRGSAAGGLAPQPPDEALAAGGLAPQPPDEAVAAGGLAPQPPGEAVAAGGLAPQPPGEALAAGGLAPQPPDEAMAAGARRALVVEGELPDLTGARVVSIGTPANIAVGEVPWGIAPDVTLQPGQPLPDGPLVVQVRDAHRHPAVAATLERLDGSAGRAVVVEWGWPGPHHGGPRICTRGSSRPMVAAVEDIIGEAGWRRWQG